MKTFYSALNSITNPTVDNVERGVLMDLTFPKAVEILERMTKQSTALHTRDSKV